MKRIRCAIYTRKSTEEGLEQDFNSLDAQWEACSAYIASQKHEGWVLLPKHYDDGGLSGGTMDRPALQQLMRDVDDGSVDQIVVYKIDRLTRSLADFAKLVDRLDAAGASFVSVTQSFNTSTSMGRLTLNVLLSFAQFEREVTAERIRDKIAASKAKGMWMGGNVPLGYDANGRTLTINEIEAETVRTVFDLYEQHGTIRSVAIEAERLGLRSKTRQTRTGATVGGCFLKRGQIHYLLTNPVYAGYIRHKQIVHEGAHLPIINPIRWQSVQDHLKAKASRARRKPNGAVEASPLAGKLFDETGDRLTPSHANKQGRRYRYYVSNRLVKRSGEMQVDGWRLPAKALEDRIAGAVLRHVKTAASNSFLINPDAGQVAKLQTVVTGLVNDDRRRPNLLMLVHEARLNAGCISVELEPDKLAETLKVKSDEINPDQLRIVRSFQARKRSVETKLVIGNSSKSTDPVLIRNIARAHHWYEKLKSGQTVDEIAKSTKISNRRVMQIITMAFLAPDVVQRVLSGGQPIGLTSEWLQRCDLPLDWNMQRERIKTL